jgi:hypothetical protein
MGLLIILVCLVGGIYLVLKFVAWGFSGLGPFIVLVIVAAMVFSCGNDDRRRDRNAQHTLTSQ